ncbi:MAG: tetratricopeptide repeat protein [Terriglobales bacterium]
MAIAVTAGLAAWAQAPSAPVPQTSHQGPRSGVTVRKIPAPTGPQDMAATEAYQAEAAMDKRDYATGEKLLHQAVTHDPKSYRAWFDFGMLYSQTGRPADAITSYQKAIADNPKLFEANFNLGILLARAGDPAAETYLRAATQLTPTMGKREDSEWRAWMTLGQFLRTTKPAEAVDAFQHAAALKPKDAEPHVLAAQSAEKAGDMQTAAKEYEAAQQLDPNNADAAAGTANVLVAAGKLDEAEAAIRKYITVVQGEPDKSNLAKAHVELGRVLMKLHRRDEAIAEFEEAKKLGAGEAPAAQELAWMYLQDKQYDKAESAFRQLLQASPKDADLHAGLGEALIPQKKFGEAQQELLAAVQLKPDQADAYSDLAFAASENKNYVLTVRALDARAKYAKESAGTMFLRATALDHLGDKQNAAASYREFLRLSDGKFPDQEWQARHRLVAIQPEKK